MNSYFALIAVRRVLPIVVALSAVFFGHHMIANAQQDSVNNSIDHADKVVQKDVAQQQKATDTAVVKGLPKSSSHVQNKGDGTLKVHGGGTTVTVKGLPTAK